MRTTAPGLIDSELSDLIELLDQPCHVEVSWPTPVGYDRKKLNVTERRAIVEALRATRR